MKLSNQRVIEIMLDTAEGGDNLGAYSRAEVCALAEEVYAARKRAGREKPKPKKAKGKNGR